MKIYVLHRIGFVQAFKTIKSVASVLGVDRKQLSKNLDSGIYMHNPTKSIVFKAELEK